MKRRHKLRLLAAATACLMALLPAIAMAGEQGEVASAQITKTCITPAQDIKPGSTVQFQIRIQVSGSTGEAIGETVLTDAWSQGFEMQGEPTVSDGFKLIAQTPGERTASYEVQTFYEGEYDQGLMAGDDLTITCTMKVAETATGTLTNEATLTGTAGGQPMTKSAKATVTVVTDNPADSPSDGNDKVAGKTKSGAKATTKDDSPKTGDPLPAWILMLLERIGL